MGDNEDADEYVALTRALSNLVSNPSSSIARRTGIWVRKRWQGGRHLLDLRRDRCTGSGYHPQWYRRRCDLMAMCEETMDWRSKYRLHTLVFIKDFLKVCGWRCLCVLPVVHVWLQGDVEAGMLIKIAPCLPWTRRIGFLDASPKQGTRQRCIRSSSDPDELSEVAILSGDPRLQEDVGDERE